MTPRMSAGIWSVWTINVISLALLGSITGRQFSSGEIERQSIAVEVAASDTLNLQLLDQIDVSSIVNLGHVKLDDDKLYLDRVHLSILRSKSGKYEMEVHKSSRGRNMEEAAFLANEIRYDLIQQENSLVMPRSFIIEQNGKYRGQSVELILRVPDGAMLTLDKDLYRLLETIDVHEHQITPWGHRGKVWKMGVEGLICIDCPESKVGDESFTFKDFTKLQIEGKMKVEINRSDEFRIHLTGKEVYTRKVEVVQTKEHLSISGDLKNPNSPVRLYIDLPYLEELDLDQTDDVKISGFVQSSMRIKSESKDDLKAYINVDSLHLSMKDRTEFDIRGSGKYLKANLHNRSRLDCEHYTVDVATINTQNYSRASVSVVDTLYKNRQNDSRINYDDDPRIVIDSQQ